MTKEDLDRQELAGVALALLAFGLIAVPIVHAYVAHGEAPDETALAWETHKTRKGAPNPPPEKSSESQARGSVEHLGLSFLPTAPTVVRAVSLACVATPGGLSERPLKARPFRLPGMPQGP